MDLKLSSKAILAGSLILSACGDPDTHWKDGNYRVYSRPHSREIILGYNKGDGAVLGLSEPTVTAAGANNFHIVYQVNTTEYFYIKRESEEEGVSIGPFNESEYSRLAENYSLPPFEWHR